MYFDDFFGTLSSVSFLRLAVNSGAYNMIFIFISMLLGLCAAGSIFLYALPFVKGLGIGCVCSFIYSEYALKGVLYCSLIVFLPALVQLISILLACSESRLMSGDILRLIDKKETENEEISVKFYILRYLIIILFIAFSGIIYSLLCRVLALII